MAGGLNETSPPDEGTVVEPESAGTTPPLDNPAREHFLVILTGRKQGQRIAVDARGLTIGRKPPAQLVLPESQVSARHCSVSLSGDELVLTDLGSSNGSFVAGQRVGAPTTVRDGACFRLGDQWLRYEYRSRGEIEAAGELLRDLGAAGAYLRSLLPAPGRLRGLELDWCYQPCAEVGGDLFGCHALGNEHDAMYLLDVSGHGTPAALHTAALVSLLRHSAVPGADMLEPAQVVARLNALFPMEAHGDMFFTIWYGVYARTTRRLRFCSAGHPPAILLTADRRTQVPLATPNLIAGAFSDISFRAAGVDVPPGAWLYLFSDGAYETADADGKRRGLADFIPLLSAPPAAASDEARRLYDAAIRTTAGGTLDDDFSMLVIRFDA